jgi:Na+/H+ antiporter NhaD/arsenite permease-like protein
VGSIEYVGIIDILGNLLNNISSNNLYITFISVLWLSSFFSTMIDNITATRVLIPTVGFLTAGFNLRGTIFVNSGILYGINWGDNLSPFGDTLVLIGLAEQNKVKISMTEMFKATFPITIFQLSMITIFFGLFTFPLLFLWILIGTLFPIIIIMLSSHKYPQKRKRHYIKTLFNHKNRQK